MQLRLEMAENQQVIAATVVARQQSAVQLQAFAAPRSEGIWEDVRREIFQRGSRARAAPWTSGARAPSASSSARQVPVQAPDGSRGVQLVRFIGVDGPRWFLRGVVSGQGAVQPQEARAIEHVFRDTVVNRGGTPMAPRDPIPLKMPTEAQKGFEEAQQQAAGGPQYSQGDLNPFERGPEITEIR